MLYQLAQLINSLEDEGFVKDANILDRVFFKLSQVDAPETEETQTQETPVIQPQEQKPVFPVQDNLPSNENGPSTVQPMPSPQPQQPEPQNPNPNEAVKALLDSTIAHIKSEGLDDTFIASPEGKARVQKELQQALQAASSIQH